MRVRRLEISGFKSFADRAVLDFATGMCGVVGPNGCGKSNVVDAIRWVLGEQSARQLRGSAMEDVIFGGADGRSPGGMAEVSLVFENTGSVTASQFADLAEIAISRRLYRNGDSEYLVNKVPCRLKDIQQLLMDTGLGNRAYAIIEQGRVAAFIEARPEERRLWVEEAAGITRYKNQKKVSLRKMQATQENLNRLEDILAEVGAQMERLKRQAKKALAHNELKGRIRDLDLAISSHQYADLGEQAREVGADAEAARVSLSLAQGRVAEVEAALEAKKTDLVGAEQEIADAGARRLEAQGAIQKAENDLILLGREAENTQRQLARIKNEQVELTGRLKTLEQDSARARRQAEQSRRLAAEAKAAAAEADEMLGSRQEEQVVWERRADEAKAALVDHLSRASQAKNRLGDLDRRTGELARRQETLAQRRADLEDEQFNLSQAKEQAEVRAEEARVAVSGLEQRRQETVSAGRAAAQAVSAARAAEQEAARAEHRLAAQAEALATSLASADWAGEGVAKALKAAEKGELGCRPMGLVAQKLKAAPGREAVVAAALGPDLQALVVAMAADLAAVASWAQASGAGRIRVVALDSLGPAKSNPPKGAEPVADLVTPEPGAEALLALLAGAGWCEDLDQALAAAADMAPGQVVVTAQGAVLDRPGAATVGQGGEGSVLSRQNQLDACRAELETARAHARQTAETRQKAEQRREALEAEAAEFDGQARELEGELRRAEQELFRVGESLEGHRRRLEAMDFDEDELASERDQLEMDRERLEAQAEELTRATPEMEEALAEAQERLAMSREDLEESRSAQHEARLAAATQEQQAAQAEREARRAQEESQAAEQRLGALASEQQTLKQSLGTLEERKARGQSGLGALYLDLDRQEESLVQAREVQAKAQGEAAELESQLKAGRSELKRAEEADTQLNWRLRELELKRQNLVDQVTERCRVDLRLVFNDHLPEGRWDAEAEQAKLEKLRKRLARLGPVNLEAISEHEALKERHHFLSEQKGDLEASLDDLRRAIRKINKTSRGRFTETLEKVNRRLAGVFPVLFGGGSARLELEEGVDPLEAGLHLLVEPPGKRIRNLDALSGGEKALSAVAVLFALFLIRPAPFCILDEVDAPLDEANTGRFLDLLKDLSRRSQILMVTHNRRSMEIVDLLYGVTMEHKGVSRLLSVSLAEGEEMAA